MDVYIDIDGVLLTRSLSVPDFGEEFIDYLVSNHNCHWLTTHCRAGENKTIQYLSMHYGQEVLDKLKLIKAADWMDKKTEAIDFTTPFIWLDDYPFNAEKEDLQAHGVLDSLIVVDLSNDNELFLTMQRIRNIDSQ